MSAVQTSRVDIDYTPPHFNIPRFNIFNKIAFQRLLVGKMAHSGLILTSVYVTRKQDGRVLRNKGYR